ncbi:hypothetical protein RJ639_016599 [Escallonia herrerae]|uniref:Uncharacterized protein n=1 Tax=Escallonia herrerae TaxID=1293975 RepID=A0AA88VD49_9ASTE|nr:hypothetical protein RJ639_016599 [Escallonia herrerae]
MAAEIKHALQGSEMEYERMPSEVREKTRQTVVEMIGKEIAKFKAQLSSKKFEPPCIYRVPDKLYQVKKPAYTPSVVSIGPIHRRQKDQNMEEIKVNYMHRLFKRTSKSSSRLEDDDVFIQKCVAALLEKLSKARSCYNEVSSLPDDALFAKMMLTDGAFIIELLWTSRKRYKKSNDPIFGNTLKFHNVRHDLLLLENQIPFFVLEDLFNLTVKEMQKDGGPSLSDFILEFFGNLMFSKRRLRKRDDGTPLHILGLLHTCYLPCRKDGLGDDPSRASDLEAGLGEDIDFESWSTGWLSWLCGTTGTPFTTQPYHPIMKHSATELASAGVNFKPREAADLDVEFNTSCWFHWFCSPWTSDIPPCCIYNRSKSSFCFLSWFFLLCGKTRFAITPLCIEDSTESFLRNLIAFEQCMPGIQTYFTSYAFLIYTLIDDEEDVELLEKAGVLRENLGARQNTLKLFKNLCKEVVLADFSFFAQWKEVHKYCNSYSHKNLARQFRSDYGFVFADSLISRLYAKPLTTSASIKFDWAQLI